LLCLTPIAASIPVVCFNPSLTSEPFAESLLTAACSVSCCSLFALISTLPASIPVVGFNAVLMSEHFGSFLVAAIMHAALAVRWVKSLLPPRQFEYATRLVLLGGACGLAGMVLMVLGYVVRSPTFGWTGGACCVTAGIVGPVDCA
jgi:hypothetical protein